MTQQAIFFKNKNQYNNHTHTQKAYTDSTLERACIFVERETHARSRQKYTQ